MSSSPYPDQANCTQSPAPAYHPGKTDNDNWDFFGESSNYHLSENVIFAGPDNINTTTSSSKKDSLPYAEVNYNPYRFEGVNRNNNDDILLDTRDKQSRIKRLFRVDTPLQRRYYALDTRLGTCTLIFQAIYYLAALILLCVASASIKLYEDPWNQSGVVGGATLAYCLAGLVVACVAGTFTICLTFINYYSPLWAFVLQCVLMVLYALGGALTGYGSYITRNNQVCNNKYTGDEFRDCYNIRLSSGWRCGIVAVAMCGVIILAQIVYSAKWVISWLTGKKTTPSSSTRWRNPTV